MRRIPIPVLMLLAADVLLIALPVLDFALGSPFARLRQLVSLDGETTLQAWYSSMQWFIAALLYGALFIHTYRSQLRGTLAIGLFASLCLIFSIDEIVWIHEWLGQKLDVLLPGGDRANTAFSRTGIWPFVIGIPVLATITLVVLRARSLFLPSSPQAFRLLVVGIAIMFTGALAVELMVNALERPEVYSAYSAAHLAQHASEEFLEMLGVTLIVWSGIEIVQAHGIELTFPAALAQSSATRTAKLMQTERLA